MYYFTPSVTKAYSVTINCSSAVDLGCRMYDNAGVLIGSSTLTGHMTVNLIEGQKYFFDVYSKNETVTDYTFNIS